MITNDGGPAFARPSSKALFNSPQKGMSLRDYFAAHSNITYEYARLIVDKEKKDYTVKDVLKQQSYMQYAHADLMIEMRNNNE